MDKVLNLGSFSPAHIGLIILVVVIYLFFALRGKKR